MSEPKILRRRINGVYLFTAEESRCNGEPNDDGRPRQDPETGHLWWNDAALKRFFRESMLQRYHNKKGYRVLIQHGYPINECQEEAFAELGHATQDLPHADDDGAEKTRKNKAPRLTEELKAQARGIVARDFMDTRWFGAVLDTGYGIGNLVGPLQFQIARSLHPVHVSEGGVTIVSVRSRKDFDSGKRQDMGTKYVVPFALFRGNFTYTPAYGEKTGFSVDDFGIFLDMLKDPFSSRQSAGAGTITLRKAWLFLHKSSLGNMQPGELVDRVQVSMADKDKTPSSLRDFAVTFDDKGLEKRGISVYTEENLDALLDAVRRDPGKA